MDGKILVREFARTRMEGNVVDRDNPDRDRPWPAWNAAADRRPLRRQYLEDYPSLLGNAKDPAADLCET